MSEASPGQLWYAWFVAHGKQEQPRWEQWSREQQGILENVAHLTWEWACVNALYAPQRLRESHGTHGEGTSDTAEA